MVRKSKDNYVDNIKDRREHSLNIFKQILNPKIQEYAVKIERSIYNHTCRWCTENNIEAYEDSWEVINFYNEKVYNICVNLDPESELNGGKSYLMDKLINGELKPKELITLTTEQLNPDKNKKLIELINTKKQQKIVEKTTDIYKCPKCKERETVAREVQLNGLDEATHTHVRCVKCQHEWKF